MGLGEIVGQILRHLARESDDMGDLALPQQAADMAGERGIAEQAVRNGLAAQHRRRERERAGDVAHFDAQALAQRRHLAARDLRLGLIVGERGDMDGGELRQRLEHMPTADTVAAVGGPGRAVDEEQDFGHQPLPSLRAKRSNPEPA